MIESPVLLLMRHAKSSWKHANLSDHDRPLNQRGAQAARDMAHFLKQRSLVPVRILSSSALRAVLTARAMAAEFEISEIQIRPQLYEADISVWQELLALIPTEETTLIIGHNPAMEELVSEIAGEVVAFPTAAIAACSVKAGETSFAIPQLTLRNLWRPSEVMAD